MISDASNAASIRDLVEQKEWDEVVSALRREECRGEQCSQVHNDGWTIMHGLIESYCKDEPAIETNALGDLISGLVDSNPQMLRSKHGDLKVLPLHSAVQNILPFPLITKLICGYPEAVDTKNAVGHYPRDLVEKGAYGGTWNLRYLDGALLCLLKNKLWERATDFVEKTEKGRKSAKVDGTLNTAIEYEAPSSLLRAIITAYPDALKKQVDGDYPLHCAIEANISPEIIEMMIRLHPCALDRKGAERKSCREMALETIPRSNETSDLLKMIERPTSYWKALPLEDAEALKQAKSRIAQLEERVSLSETQQKKSEEKQHELASSNKRVSRQSLKLRKQNDNIRASERKLVAITSNGLAPSSSDVRDVISCLNSRLDSIEAPAGSKARAMESDLISSAAKDPRTSSQYLLKLLGFVDEKLAVAERKESSEDNGASAEDSSDAPSKKRKVNM